MVLEIGRKKNCLKILIRMIGCAKFQADWCFGVFIGMKSITESLIYCVTLVSMLVGGLSLPSTAIASDSEYIFRWTPGHSGVNIDLDNAGVPSYIEVRYDTVLKRLKFELNVVPTDYSMRAFAVVVTDGPYPHYGGGQYAVYYFDASNLNAPVMTVYPYNANDDENDSLSYMDGRIDNNTQLPPQFRCGAPCSGIQPPNRICTSLNPAVCPGWLQSMSAQSEANGSRTFRFTVSTAIVNAFPISYPNWLNPALYPWQGTVVGGNIGVCVRGYGLLNGPVTYRSDGFIQDLPVPIGNHHMSIFGTCLLAPVTFREPYCDGPTGSLSVQVGQAFSANFRGVSPDQKGLAVTYSGLPSGVVVTPISGSAATGTLRGTINWTPVVGHAGGSYPVSINYRQSDGVTFSCPFSLQVPGLGCTSRVISDLLHDLDGLAHAQAANVKKLTRRYVRIAKGTRLEKAAETYRSAVNKQADALFNVAWGVIWSIPQVITTCTNAPFCVTTSHASSLSSFEANSQQLYALSVKTNSLIRKAKANAKNLLKEAESLRGSASALSASVPTSTTSCGG